jgi:hypothetical protein
MMRVGQVLDGYSGGAFELGPDHVRVEAIGADWVVVRAVDSTQWSYPQLFVGDIDELHRDYSRDLP